MANRVRSASASLFFRYFFPLFLVTISIAQWVCVAWIITLVSAGDIPSWLHICAVSAIYAFNRWLVTRPRPAVMRPPGAMYRLYSASAFVSVFCFIFLVVSGAVWSLAIAVASQMQAVTTVPMAAATTGTLDGAFRWFASGGMGAITLLFAYGYIFGQRQLAVTDIAVPCDQWQGSAPLRIVQLSDIHVGQNLSEAELHRFVEHVNELDADLICITGDIIDAPRVDYGRYLPILAKLRARAGVIAILGNHDHRAGADEVVQALESWTPFRVLLDEAHTVEVHGARLHVIGLDDRGRDWARGHSADEQLTVLIDAAPIDVPKLLLVHRPDIFPQAASSGVVLTLAGHTHGGQLALPWRRGRRVNLADFITRYPRGFYDHAGHFLYVNCGLGVTGQRIRLFTPREIAVLELSADHSRS